MRVAPNERPGTLDVAILAGAGSSYVWTNQPAAATFLLGSTTHISQVDLTNYHQVRLLVNMQSVAANTNATIYLRYNETYSTTLLDYTNIGDGAATVTAGIDVTDSLVDSGWVTLAPGARADVYIAVIGDGGDGVIDPTFGAIHVQFRKVS